MNDLAEQIRRAAAAELVSVTVTASSYAMTSADRVVRLDCTTGPRTVILPAALSVVGAVLYLVKVDATANVATVLPQSPDVIGSADATVLYLTAPDQSLALRAARNGDVVVFDNLSITTSADVVIADFWPDPFTVAPDADLAFFDESLSFF